MSTGNSYNFVHMPCWNVWLVPCTAGTASPRLWLDCGSVLRGGRADAFRRVVLLPRRRNYLSASSLSLCGAEPGNGRCRGGAVPGCNAVSHAKDSIDLLRTS